MKRHCRYNTPVPAIFGGVQLLHGIGYRDQSQEKVVRKGPCPALVRSLVSMDSSSSKCLRIVPESEGPETAGNTEISPTCIINIGLGRKE